MINSTCCFTGHRDICENDLEAVKQNVDKILKDLILKGYKYFGTGGAVGFDALAAKAVIELKKSNKDIKLILVLPCKDQDKFWSLDEKVEYKFIKENADKIIYTGEKYDFGCMQKRNRHLVDNSSVCIAYVKKSRGGAAYTASYAKNKGKTVIFVC